MSWGENHLYFLEELSERISSVHWGWSSKAIRELRRFSLVKQGNQQINLKIYVDHITQQLFSVYMAPDPCLSEKPTFNNRRIKLFFKRLSNKLYIENYNKNLLVINQSHFVNILNDDLKENGFDSLVIVYDNWGGISKFSSWEKSGITKISYHSIEEFRSSLRKITINTPNDQISFLKMNKIFDRDDGDDDGDRDDGDEDEPIEAQDTTMIP
ncbi:hypothetical protein Glove_64g64 [Diversispora epigaea]|uniref:Uncharacterized protein n=1 Tax=Diversispora epigaea TaxID=1348612 RepID=A0A397JHU7_9GLOM|nr:hypothetical protein Glove_64g64 [Diversispora epigaea]